jgi:hypothetical protein
MWMTWSIGPLLNVRSIVSQLVPLCFYSGFRRPAFVQSKPQFSSSFGNLKVAARQRLGSHRATTKTRQQDSRQRDAMAATDGTYVGHRTQVPGATYNRQGRRHSTRGMVLPKGGFCFFLRRSRRPPPGRGAIGRLRRQAGLPACESS